MKYLIFLISLTASGFTQAITLPELCSYDPDMCEKAWDHSRKAWRKPAKEVAKIVDEMAPLILEYSKKYGVDPRAAAGAVIAENTMNVNLKDRIQQALIEREQKTADDLMHQKWSYGPGQINLPAAMDAENHVARLGFRTPRTKEDVMQRIRTPGGSAEYAVAIIRRAQDAYKERGMDISNRPDILSTLYNLGQYDKRALDSQSRGGQIRPNYFGVFVQENLKAVEELIGWSPERGQFRSFERRFMQEGDLGILKAKVPLMLHASPSYCLSNKATGVIEQISNFKTEFMQGNQIKVIGRGVDCEMSDWTLVQTNYGQTGWITRSDLEETMTPQTGHQDLICGAPTPECKKEIAELYGADFISSKSESGLHYLPIAKWDDQTPADWRTGLLRCTSEGQYEASKAQLSNEPWDPKKYVATQYASIKKIDKADLPRYIRDVETKRGELQKLFAPASDSSASGSAPTGPSPFWTPYANPYGFGARSTDPFSMYLSNISHRLSRCEHADECRVKNLDVLDQFLKTPSSEIKSIKGIKMAEQLGRVEAIDIRYHQVQRPQVNPLRSGRMFGAVRKLSADERRSLDANAETLKSELRSKCDGLLKDNVSTRGEYATLFDLINADILAHGGRSGFDSQMIQPLNRACQDIQALKAFKATGQKSWSPGAICGLNLGSSSMGGLFGSFQAGNLAYDLLADLDLKDDDYISLVQSSLSNVSKMLQSSHAILQMAIAEDEQQAEAESAEGKAKRLKQCNYNPEKTKELIEKIAQSSCVQSVFSGDVKLVSEAKLPRTTMLVKMPQLQGDQIAVSFKGACTAKSAPKKKDVSWKAKWWPW